MPFIWVSLLSNECILSCSIILLSFRTSLLCIQSSLVHSHPLSQILMSNLSQMGPQRFIRCYFQILRQTTNNYYDDSYYYGSKGMTHWEPRERACDVNCWGQNCFTRGCSPELASAFGPGHYIYGAYLCTLDFLSYCPAPLQCPNSGHFIFTYCNGSQPS